MDIYGLRISKWKAGVRRRRDLAHFFPPASNNPSPSQDKPILYTPLKPRGLGSVKINMYIWSDQKFLKSILYFHPNLQLLGMSPNDISKRPRLVLGSWHSKTPTQLGNPRTTARKLMLHATFDTKTINILDKLYTCTCMYLILCYLCAKLVSDYTLRLRHFK